MDKSKFQTALESRSVRFALTALLAMAVKWGGLPMLPDDVSNEVILLAVAGLDAIVVAAVAAAAWFRIKARKIIDGWL
jgi:hypothetical protein